MSLFSCTFPFTPFHPYPSLPNPASPSSLRLCHSYRGNTFANDQFPYLRACPQGTTREHLDDFHESLGTLSKPLGSLTIWTFFSDLFPSVSLFIHLLLMFLYFLRSSSTLSLTHSTEVSASPTFLTFLQCSQSSNTQPPSPGRSRSQHVHY